MGINPNENFYYQNQRARKKFAVLEFAQALGKYIRERSRQFSVFGYAGLEVVVTFLSGIKSWTVQRMFWGRSSLYRSSFHLIVSVVTIIAILSGISSRLNIISASESEGLDITSGIIGRQDILSQSGTAESISVISANEPDYEVFRHVVESGETLSEIAEKYEIGPSTIRWANNMSDDTIKPGQVLRIPGIDGAFIKVKSGETLSSIATKYNGNVADIIDLNSNVLDYRDPVIREGMELFIPNGKIPLPPKPTAAPYVPGPGTGTTPPPSTGPISPGSWVNPLANCPGYSYSRGFSPWHGGVDLAKNGGCWINAARGGTVIRAGWGYAGEGFHVVIDHGGGYWTRYYHGNGQFAVSTGQKVNAGQTIMHMGNTGYSFGTHLHFEVVLNGYKQNPESYVRVR